MTSTSVPQSDQRDEEILRQRMEALDSQEGPRVGDYVRFSDGVARRISYHWTDGAGWDGGCQTSDIDGSGSYYLGNGYVSMSGSLRPAVPTESLTLTDERQPGAVWIFHHDVPGAGRGVTFYAKFRVYRCSLPSN